MKVNLIEKKGSKLVFLLNGATPAFANALRRIMVSEIPTMAIETVDFLGNSSALFDEMIAHRLGMLPIAFDPSKFNFRKACKCGGKGCTLCQVVFVIDKTGPCVVYSGDMKSSNRDAKPSSPDFPIVELLGSQSIKLEAAASLGTGKEHAKWQAANASYQYYPELVVKDMKDAKKCIKACPKALIIIKGNKPVLSEPEKCDMCKACLDGCPGIEVRGDPTRFIFRVESISGLKPDYIVSKAAEILEEKAEEFRKELKKLD